MLQNPRKTLGFKKNMVYKIPPGGGGKPYPASGLNSLDSFFCLFALCSPQTINRGISEGVFHFPGVYLFPGGGGVRMLISIETHI